MNWTVFSDWCERKLLPSITATKKITSVVILGIATYILVIGEEYGRPVTSCNKERLIDAIRRWRGTSENWPLTWERMES